MASFFSSVSASVYELIFRGLARRRPIKSRPIQLSTTSRVLIFTCAGIGDTLTDSVVFKAMRESYPGIHLAAVVHRRRRGLVEHNPYVDKIFLFHKGPQAFWHLKDDLRAAGPWDAILHLRGNDPEPRCVSYLLDPGVTVSVPSMTKLSDLCGHNVPQADWDLVHGVEQTLRLARHVGANTRDPHLVYQVTTQERQMWEETMRRMIIRAGPRLVLQLGGGLRAAWRDWPVERYAQLIQLIRSHNLQVEIFVTGGEDQLERLHALDKFFPADAKPYHSLVNKLTLAETAALLASAKVLVSTDTGIMHLGFAVGGVRVIALIHCNNPVSRVGPYGYGAYHSVLQLPRPFNYRSPSDGDMGDITAQTVYTELQDLWY